MTQQMFPQLSGRLDLTRFIDFQANPHRPRFRVAGVGRRHGETGACIGTLGVKHCGGYSVLLEFDDGKVDSFNPHNLFPAEGGGDA